MKNFNTPASVQHDAGSDAVSRPELERLQAQRRKPVIERHLTPDGAQQVQTAENMRCENRIRHIEERLDSTANKALLDFSKAKIRSRAKHDFDRSR